MCSDCPFYYSESSVLDLYQWDPICHCFDSDCPFPRAERLSLSLNDVGVPGFRAAAVFSFSKDSKDSFIPSDFLPDCLS